MGAFDSVNLDAFTPGGNLNWDEGGYHCEPIQFVEPEVGGVYRMAYAFSRRGNVTVLGVFDELVVVRHERPKEDGGGYMSFEEAVVRRKASFSLVGTEVTSATDADTPVEQLSAPDL